jgi:hypothetical protein
MTAHTLVQGVLAARRDLRLKHELAVLDVSDAMTILVTPPPHPERSTDGPWLGPDDNYPDDNYSDDNYPDDNYLPRRQLPRSALADHNVACHLVHDNHDPKPRAQHRRPLARQPQQRLTHSPRRIPRRNSGRPRTVFNEPRSMGRCRCR